MPKPNELAALAILAAAPREPIVARIAEICAVLKKRGVPFAERLRLNNERHFLREQLALIDSRGAE